MRIRYEFRFDDGREEAFDMAFDPATMALQEMPGASEEDWTRQDCHRCACCTLDLGDGAHCPVARNLSPVMERFRNDLSYTKVLARVVSEERVTEKRASLQDAVSPLLGLVMATSGCPALDRFRPMAYTHLPFANTDETIMRSVSCYLAGQFVRQSAGLAPDWNLDGFADMYAGVTDINVAFAERLRTREAQDAGINALLILDTFGRMAAFPLEEWVAGVRPVFRAYLTDAPA